MSGDKIRNEERDGEEWGDKNRILRREMRKEKMELFARRAQEEGKDQRDSWEGSLDEPSLYQADSATM